MPILAKVPAGAPPAFELRSQWLWDSLAVVAGMVAFATAFGWTVRTAGGPNPVDAAQAPVPWVPFGIVVSALFYRGLNRAPAGLVGTFATSMLVGHFPWPAALMQSLAATACAIVIRALLRAWRVDGALQRWQDPLLLWSAAACGAALLAAFAGTVVLMLGGRQPASTDSVVFARNMLNTHGLPIFGVSLFRLAGGWWANWTSGVALVVPALRLLNGASRRTLAERSREALIVALILPAWGAFAFAPLPWVFGLPLCLIALVLVTWSAIRLGAAAVAAIVLALALIECAAFIADRGPLQAHSDQTIVVVWTFITVVSVIGMLITSLLAERDAAARRQAASEARYRTLFDSNPQPLWVQDGKNQRILMVNEAAIRHYGYTREEFTALHETDLEAQKPPVPGSEAADAPTAQGQEREHRGRDGRPMTVELRRQPIEFDGRDAVLVFSYDVTDRNRLRTAFIDSADRAARHLGQELHDGLGQELVGLSLIARSQMTRLGRGAAPDAESLGAIDAIAQRAVMACRNIAHGLSALTETGGDLAIALNKLPQRFAGPGMPAICVDLPEEAAAELPDAVCDHLYRIAQEALTNAVKHARARRVEVRFAATPTHVVLSVRDDGVGLPRRPSLDSGIGLSSMQHRAAAMGARLCVTAADGGGTEVRVELSHGRAAMTVRCD